MPSRASAEGKAPRGHAKPIACKRKEPRRAGLSSAKNARSGSPQCFSVPEAAPDAPAFEPGETLLPEPQSLLAIFEEVSLLPLVPAPELLVGALDALLPGPQSVWCMPLVARSVLTAPLGLELVPAFPVLLVWAMAAVARLRAKIDAAVMIRRFIGFPPIENVPRGIDRPMTSPARELFRKTDPLS
jgi:hypothetical protein